jgi:hypothetical protein
MREVKNLSHFFNYIKFIIIYFKYRINYREVSMILFAIGLCLIGLIWSLTLILQILFYEYKKYNLFVKFVIFILSGVICAIICAVSWLLTSKVFMFGEDMCRTISTVCVCIVLPVILSIMNKKVIHKVH